VRHLRLLSASVSTVVLAGTVVATSVAPTIAVVHRPRVAERALQNAGWASSNWSGYAKAGSYTKVTGAWVVPSVAASSKPTYASQWVGIDGFNNGRLIQTGTETDYYNGSAHYSAWWEILPAAETVIPSIAVHPRDHMTASIVKGTGSSWTITIKNTTTGASYTTKRTYTGPGSSVEWIEEAPTVGGHQATLARYSSPDTFDPGTANGANPRLKAADGGVMIRRGVRISTPSVPDADTDGFNMAYGSTAPQPPGS
jgi:hypothetical protein